MDDKINNFIIRCNKSAYQCAFRVISNGLSKIKIVSGTKATSAEHIGLYIYARIKNSVSVSFNWYLSHLYKAIRLKCMHNDENDIHLLQKIR